MATTIYGKRRGHLFVAEWMEHRNLSDEKLANRLGVDRVTVTRWRNQQHRLNPEKIAAIAVPLTSSRKSCSGHHQPGRASTPCSATRRPTCKTPQPIS